VRDERFFLSSYFQNHVCLHLLLEASQRGLCVVSQQLAHVDPRRVGRVKRQPKFVFFARHRQTLDHAALTVDRRQTAAAILVAPRNHLDGHGGAGRVMMTQQLRVQTRSGGVDVVHQQRLDSAKLCRIHQAQNVDQLKEMPWRMQ
jgi:hypothetical protein